MANIYTEDRDTITVALERFEDSREIQLVVMRSGVVESCFSRTDLGRVLELATILYKNL